MRTLIIFLILAAAVTAALLGWRAWRRRRTSGPSVSLVLLRDSSAGLDEAGLRRIAAGALGVEFDSEDPDATDFVVGEPPTFVVKLGERIYLVHDLDLPYFDDPEEVAEQMGEVRLAEAVRRHSACVMVALGAEAEDVAGESAYGPVGKMAAALADEGCLAVYCPQTGEIVAWRPELRAALAGPDPLGVFADSRRPAPVVSVPDDDPEMAAAAAEARRRWGEFVVAFEARQPGWHFSVKVPISDGETMEYMWVDVTAIEGERIRGRLGNDPVSVQGVQLGDPVDANLKDLNDWTYSDGEEVFGGFTVEVLRRAGGRGGR